MSDQADNAVATTGSKRKLEEDDEAHNAKRARPLQDESLTALLLQDQPANSIILLDSKTGLPRRVEPDELALYDAALIGDLSTPAVVEALRAEMSACTDQEKPLSEEATARVAAAVLKHNALYDYFGGCWYLKLPPPANTALPRTSHRSPDPKGDALCRLIQGAVATVLREYATANDSQPAYLTAVWLAHSIGACRRIAEHMERLLLWHTPPALLPLTEPGAPTLEQEVQRLRDWLARRGRLVRGDAERHGQAAFVRDVWADRPQRHVTGGQKRFVLLLSRALGEWPRKHSWRRKPHWVGYQWIE